MENKRGFSKKELLELLISEREENEFLKTQVAKLKEQLESRELKITQAGSLAEAVLELNGVFEAAEAACKQYIDNYVNTTALQDTIVKREKASIEKAVRIIEDAKQRAQEMEAETQKYCSKLISHAKAEATNIMEKGRNNG